MYLVAKYDASEGRNEEGLTIEIRNESLSRIKHLEKMLEEEEEGRVVTIIEKIVFRDTEEEDAIQALLQVTGENLELWGAFESMVKAGVLMGLKTGRKGNVPILTSVK